MSATVWFDRDVRGAAWAPCGHCPHPSPGACPSRRHRRYCLLTAPDHPQADFWRPAVAAMPAESAWPGAARADLATAANLIGAIRPGAQVLIVFKRFKAHHGLGVNAAHMAEVLSRHGVPAGAVGCDWPSDWLSIRLPPTVRLLVWQAAWGDPAALIALARREPGVQFIVRCHSNVAFLYVDPNTVTLQRAVSEAGLPNLRVGAVSRAFARFWREHYGPCDWLPNLYQLDPAPRPERPGRWALRTGSFGARRPQKHHGVGAAAALILARRLGRPLVFYLNGGRDSETAVLDSCRSLLAGLPDVAFRVAGWRDHVRFRRLASTMDLCWQLSSTETFNIVTADAAASGVPTVVGEAIDWMPEDFRAPIDDPHAAAEVGARLLADPTAGARARAALEVACHRAWDQWRVYLSTMPDVGPAPRPATTEPIPRSQSCGFARPLTGQAGCRDRWCRQRGQVVCLGADCRPCPVPAGRLLEAT